MIKAAIDGIDVSNPEIKSLWVYYVCAREFGWTKEETDAHDLPFITDLMTFHEELKKKEEHEVKKR